MKRETFDWAKYIYLYYSLPKVLLRFRALKIAFRILRFSTFYSKIFQGKGPLRKKFRVLICNLAHGTSKFPWAAGGKELRLIPRSTIPSSQSSLVLIHPTCRFRFLVTLLTLDYLAMLVIILFSTHMVGTLHQLKNNIAKSSNDFGRHC